MIIPNGATGVITYWVLYDSTNHVPTTGIAVSGISLYYTKEGEAISAAVTASAHESASAAYTANYGFEIGKGLYRIDWPNIFDGGIGKRVILTVEAPSADLSYREVELSPSVNVYTITDGAIGSGSFVEGAINSTVLSGIMTDEDFNARTLASADYATPSSNLSYVVSVGTVTGSVGSVSVTTGYSLAAEYDAAKTAASQSSVDGVPTNAEFEARTLPSAQYITSGSTVANVTYVDSAGSVTGSVGSIAEGGITSGSFVSGAITTGVMSIDFATTEDFVSSGDLITALEASGRKLYSILEDTTELQANQTGWLTATGFATPTDVSGISVIDTKINVVSGYVDEIESRLTATRAGYLDNLTNLDTTVGSRAPSATALSTAVWTNTKAGYIDTTIGSRLASASYTTPPTTGDIKTSMEAEGGLLNSINSKTTNLPSDPADQSTLETLITDNALTAADVWGYATRTITSGGVTPQEIWEYATRTITSGGVTAQQIWEYTTRTITSGGLTAQQVWDYATRTITAGGLTSGEAQAAVALALVAYEAAKAGDQMDLINTPNASAVSAIQSGLATSTNLNIVKNVTDKIDTALEADGDVYRFTTNSLEMIPTTSAEITAENIEDIRIEIDTNSTKLIAILEDTSTSIPSAISSIPTGEVVTAEEIVTELLTTDYTASTGTNTIGRWFNAIRTLLGHKSVENSEGTEVSFKEDDDTTEAGTQTWDNTTKTRGKYTGW